jgi:hypothetical protein
VAFQGRESSSMVVVIVCRGCALMFIDTGLYTEFSSSGNRAINLSLVFSEFTFLFPFHHLLSTSIIGAWEHTSSPREVFYS